MTDNSRPAKRPALFNRQELALIAVTMWWGGTFLAVKTTLAYSGPLFLMGTRFLCATLFLGLISFRSLKGFTKHELFAGCAVGSMIFLGYALQTYGLQTISSSKSAFIIALYVPLVPLAQWAIFKRAPRFMNWVGVAFAFIGLILLAGPEGSDIGFSFGEILTIIAAIATGIEVILISVFAGSVDLRRVTIIQLGITSLLSYLCMPIIGEGIPDFSWVFLGFIVILGFGNALIQIGMNWAQKSISPTRATVIYAGEPVWAGIIGRIAGEKLPLPAIIGASLIVVGVLVSELKLRCKGKDL